MLLACSEVYSVPVIRGCAAGTHFWVIQEENVNIHQLEKRKNWWKVIHLGVFSSTLPNIIFSVSTWGRSLELVLSLEGIFLPNI